MRTQAGTLTRAIAGVPAATFRTLGTT